MAFDGTGKQPHLERQDPQDLAKQIYLRTLAKTGTLTHACRAAKISPHRVYQWREVDGAFLVAEKEAKDTFADELEMEATRRAWHGVLRPVFQGGVRVGYIRQHSDRLLIFMLRALRPEKYRERFDFGFQAREAAEQLAKDLGLNADELLAMAREIAGGQPDSMGRV